MEIELELGHLYLQGKFKSNQYWDVENGGFNNTPQNIMDK
jgi:hypothetical protein